MGHSKNTKRLGHIDCPGGGQVWVDGHILYVGHMRSPSGTSIYDVANPTQPKLLARLDLPEGWHSHKVRASNGIMNETFKSVSDDILNAESDVAAEYQKLLGVVEAER